MGLLMREDVNFLVTNRLPHDLRVDAVIYLSGDFDSGLAEGQPIRAGQPLARQPSCNRNGAVTQLAQKSH